MTSIRVKGNSHIGMMGDKPIIDGKVWSDWKPNKTFTDAEVWHEWERQSNIPSATIRAIRFDRTQASRAKLDKALHSTQLEPPASGLRNPAAWLAVLVAVGAVGAAIVARRGR